MNDGLTAFLRFLLGAAALYSALRVFAAYRRHHDTNPWPWAWTSGILFLYAAAMGWLLATGELVVTSWLRPMWSLLNTGVIIGAVWLIERLTRRNGDA